MKNVHILPTRLASRLYYNSQEKTYQLCDFPKYHTDIKSTHNLYITSAVEGVYDKEYYLYEGSVFQARPRDENNFKNKVILTTDPQLIADGVQAIDDDFLEWFVKNPTCEEVETIKVPYFDESGYSHLLITPKEEPKETLEEAETISDFIKRVSKSANESVGIVKGAKWQQEQDKNKIIIDETLVIKTIPIKIKQFL
jgi:hypothetical protein